MNYLSVILVISCFCRRFRRCEFLSCDRLSIILCPQHASADWCK